MLDHPSSTSSYTFIVMHKHCLCSDHTGNGWGEILHLLQCKESENSLDFGLSCFLNERKYASSKVSLFLILKSTVAAFKRFTLMTVFSNRRM